MWKLLASGDRVQDTAEFTMYLETLIEERVLTLRDLEHFLKELKQNKVVNPIPNKTASKQFTFHHEQFQELIDAGSVDAKKVQEWEIRYITKTKETEHQKSETKKEIEHIQMSSEGALFIPIKHPVFIDAIKILKPHGSLKNSLDYDPAVWSIRPLPNKYNFEGAAKACHDLGENIGLPTHDDFVRLQSYFETVKLATRPTHFSGLGKSEFSQFFGSVFANLSSIPAELGTGVWSEWHFNPRMGRIYNGNSRDNSSPSLTVLCVEHTKK